AVVESLRREVRAVRAEPAPALLEELGSLRRRRVRQRADRDRLRLAGADRERRLRARFARRPAPVDGSERRGGDEPGDGGTAELHGPRILFHDALGENPETSM